MSDSTVVPTEHVTVPATSVPPVGGAPVPPAAGGGAGPDEIVPLRRSRALAFVAGYFGIWVACFAPILIIVPMKIERFAPDDKSAALSLVLGGGALFGIVAGPIAGRLSDRCTSRWGRRRPFLVGAMVLNLVGVVGEAAATSYAVFFVGFAFTAVAFGVAIAVVLAVLPEHVPLDRRGKMSGFLGVGQSLAVVVGVGLTSGISHQSLGAAFIVPGVVGAVMVAWLVAVLPDRTIGAADRPPLSLHDVFGSYWVSPRRHPDFGWAWVSRFAIFMAFSGAVNYQVFYLRDQLGIAEDHTAALVAAGTGLQVVMVVISSALTGFLSDRTHRRRVFAIVSALVSAGGLLVIALAPGLPLYFVGVAIVGLGQGAYFAVDLALVADLLPPQRDDDARNLGVFSLANQVPTSLAPAIAPAFLAIGIGATSSGDNYTALFVASALFGVIAAVTVAKVRGVR